MNTALQIPALPIDIKGLAKLIGVSIPTLNRLKKSGKLPHHKIGGRVLFFPEDIDCLMNSSAKGERI